MRPGSTTPSKKERLAEMLKKMNLTNDEGEVAGLRDDEEGE